ncbi:MAG: penicillin-binding protein activator LpoB [Spirochaetia bacterium]|nr:penicillin-binding protein activator LpoB [Spirochaetia bacterium]
MKKLPVIAAILVVSSFFVSCAGTSVQRVDTQTITDLSGRWNDTDSQLVAEKMVSEALTFPWLKKFMTKNGREPRVKVGEIENRTDEHIDTIVFTKAIERELLKSGQVEFVASKAESSEIREERADQQEYSSEDTRKKFQKEIAADYMMKGKITSVVDQISGKKAVFYQVDLNMIDIETNQIVWPGQWQQKKIIERPGFSF